MTFFSKWFTPTAPEQTPVPEPTPVAILTSPQLIIPATNLFYRTGKWVMANNRIAVISKLLPNGNILVHYTDAQGCTESAAEVVCNDVRIARYEEIPAPRRPADYAYAAGILGYV